MPISMYRNPKQPYTGIPGSNLLFDFENLVPVSWTVNQNNLVLPTPPDSGWRVNLPSGDVDLTGLDSTGIADNTFVLLYNASSNTLKIIHNSGSSLAGNRILCPDFVDHDVPMFGALHLRRDGIAGFWHLVIGVKN